MLLLIKAKRMAVVKHIASIVWFFLSKNTYIDYPALQ